MRKEISTAEIVRLYIDEKAGRRAIAKRLGVSIELVRGRLKKGGRKNKDRERGKTRITTAPHGNGTQTGH